MLTRLCSVKTVFSVLYNVCADSGALCMECPCVERPGRLATTCTKYMS